MLYLAQRIYGNEEHAEVQVGVFLNRNFIKYLANMCNFLSGTGEFRDLIVKVKSAYLRSASLWRA